MFRHTQLTTIWYSREVQPISARASRGTADESSSSFDVVRRATPKSAGAGLSTGGGGGGGSGGAEIVYCHWSAESRRKATERPFIDRELGAQARECACKIPHTAVVVLTVYHSVWSKIWGTFLLFLWPSDCPLVLTIGLVPGTILELLLLYYYYTTINTIIILPLLLLLRLHTGMCCQWIATNWTALYIYTKYVCDWEAARPS